jgi:peptidoglycan hydrolase-like protein with peptidoglycan-binding domain
LSTITFNGDNTTFNNGRFTVTKETIRRGSTGDAVRDAQRELEARGYSVGKAGIDGIFGSATEEAVRNYQTDRSTGHDWALTYPLVVDGIVGPQTWGRLLPDTIRRGSTGPGVTLLQAILESSGNPAWDPDGVDGVFGPKTEHAVRNYQSAHGLVVDGVVGPVTWRSLRS